MNLKVGAPLPRVVLVDANVLFAPRLCDLFVHLHIDGVIRIHWTAAINEEWTRNAAAKTRGDPAGIHRRLVGMTTAVPDWEVSKYDRFIEALDGVDDKDRHVSAAALAAAVLHTVEACRTKLRAPPRSREEYVAVLMTLGCDLAHDLGRVWKVDCPVRMPDGSLVYLED